MRHVVLALVLSVLAPASAQDGGDAAPVTTTIHTWDGLRYDATDLRIDDAGVSFRASNVARTLGWHRVRAVEGAEADGATPDRLALGETVWRAGARLSRGDAFGAEPLFEAAYERTRGTVGPMPAAVADGLLRCRLRRNARASAIDAWLELAANLSVAPARVPNWGLDDPAVDPRTRLVPTLAPIWFDSTAARAFADAPLDGAPLEPGDPEAYARAIRALYHAAASFAVGDPLDPSRTARAAEIASARPGGDLVARVVLAQIGGPEVRAAARAELEKEQSLGNDRWRAVWATIAIGRSLVREPDEGDRRRGILELLAVHALDAEVAPYLTGIALADAALAAEALGDDRAASAIRADLRRQFPNHPVRERPELADSRVPGARP
jgi:hypothetical protein